MNANLRNFALWVIIVLLLLALFTLFQNPGQHTNSPGNHLLAACSAMSITGRVTTSSSRVRKSMATFTDGAQLPDLCAQRSVPGAAALQQGRFDHGAAADRECALVRLAPDLLAAVRRADRRVDFPVAADAGRRRQGAGLRQDPREAADRSAWPRHLRGCRRRRRSQAGSAGDRRIPARSRQNSSGWVAAFRAACCWSARPAPARRCSRAPSPARRMCRSSPFPAPTSSKCSSASARAACATCSSRRRRMRPASSSSTKSTRSAAIAAPASAAATTSASRRSTNCWSRWMASRPTKASS